jgi:Ca-activated chloride channel family protein
VTKHRWVAAIAAVLAWLSIAGHGVQAAEGKGAPYFAVQGTGTVERLPLLQTNASANIVGPVAEVALKQVFENRGTATIEAVYVFPASDRAAVSALTMRIGDRIVQAQLQERSEAKRTYESAKQSGHTAALLQQHDPGTFTMNLANILPGDRIEVELHYTELLVPTDGVYAFELPTTFGVEHYTRPGEQAIDTPRSDAPEVTDYSFGVNVHLAAGIPIASVDSPSHRVVVEEPSSTKRNVRLADDEVKASTRDFVLRYSLAGGAIADGLLLFPGTTENFFLLMLQPPRAPAPASIAPREFVFVLDVSGSMSGAPMDAAKAMMHSLLATLQPRDRFNLILFAGKFEILDAQTSLPVDAATTGRAMKLVADATTGGGTELIPALQAAYDLPHAAGMSRSIVVVTDGGIEAGGEAARLIRSHLDEANVFAFGTGPGADHNVMRRLARAGMGEPFFAEDENKGADETARFRSYVEQPLLTRVGAKITGFDTYDVIPERLPDLFAQRPIVMIGKYRGAARGEIVVTGTAGDHAYRSTLNVASASAGANNAPLRALWARQYIADRVDSAGYVASDSEEAHALAKLSLDYGVLTPFTAFVAVSAEQRSDGSAPIKVDQPTPLRAGITSYGGGDALQAGVRLMSDVALASIARPADGDSVDVAGKHFRRHEDLWIDARHDDTCVILRIRRGSEAYERLLALRPELSNWVALGKRVLIRLGHYSVLVGDDGFSDYPAGVLARAARG